MVNGGTHNASKAQLFYMVLGEQAPDDACLELLRTAHYAVSTVIAPGSTDIILIDTRGMIAVDDDHLLVIEDVRQSHQSASVMFIADIDLPVRCRERLKKFGTIAATGDSPDLLLDRVEALMESLAIADECGERLRTLAGLQQPVPQNLTVKPRAGKLRALVAGPPSPLSLRVLQSLLRSDLQVTAAISVKQAVAYLEITAFDCLILLPGAEQSRYGSMIKLLRRNDRTENLPVLVVPDLAEHDTLDIFGKRFLTHGADMIVADHDAEKALMSEVRLLSRRHRLSHSMRRFLRRTAAQERSIATRLCERVFFEHHLTRQCEVNRGGGKPLCVSAYRLRLRSGNPLRMKHFQQAATYAGAILRDVDLMTSVSNEILLISHPFCHFSEAERLRKQIIRLIQDMCFQEERDNQPPELIAVASSAVLFDGEEASERLIARALGSIAELSFAEANPRREQPRRPHLTIVQ